MIIALTSFVFLNPQGNPGTDGIPGSKGSAVSKKLFQTNYHLLGIFNSEALLMCSHKMDQIYRIYELQI